MYFSINLLFLSVCHSSASRSPSPSPIQFSPSFPHIFPSPKSQLRIPSFRLCLLSNNNKEDTTTHSTLEHIVQRTSITSPRSRFPPFWLAVPCQSSSASSTMQPTSNSANSNIYNSTVNNSPRISSLTLPISPFPLLLPILVSLVSLSLELHRNSPGISSERGAIRRGRTTIITQTKTATKVRVTRRHGKCTIPNNEPFATSVQRIPIRHKWAKKNKYIFSVVVLLSLRCFSLFVKDDWVWDLLRFNLFPLPIR